jgi:hypothetical protein
MHRSAFHGGNLHRALLVCLPLALACNNEIAPRALVRVDVEPSGANCAAGGAAVVAGVDDDGDGQLDAEEEDSQAFVCNGEQGPQGDQGEPGQPGQDGAGVVPLGPVVTGSVEILNQADVDALAGVTTITGFLTIQATGLPTITLPQLATVQGSVTFVAQDASSVQMPALSSVGGDFSIQFSPDLTSIGFPALTSIGGALNINSNPLLPTCQAQAIAAQLSGPPPGGVTISGNNDAGVCN